MKKTLLSSVSLCFVLFVNLLVAHAAENATAVFSPTTTLSGFQYSLGSGPSAEQSFKVSGTNLTGNLIVTAPVNYEISPLSGSSFISMSSITIAHSGGVVSELTLYVRLKSGLAANTYSGNISIASAGAQTEYIALSGAVLNPPTISTSVTSITGLYSFYNVGESVVKSVLITGSDLKAGIVVAPPYNFEISTNATSGFTTSSITLPVGVGNAISTTIYIRLYPYTYPTYDYSGNLTLTSTGATSKTVSVTGRSMYKPVLSTSTTSLTSFNYFVGAGPSAQQSFTISGTDIIDPVTITAPTNYEISTYNGTSFSGQSSITLYPSYYSLYSTTIYVRLKSGLTAGTYGGNLTCTSTSAATKTISLSGSVTSQPVVNVSTTSLTGFRYNLGSGPSTEKMFTVSGSSLSSIIFIYAPTNYEISTNGGSAFAATSSIVLPQSGGTVAATNIYVRLKAGLAEGNYNENVTIASSTTPNQLVSLSGTVVNPNGITVSETALSGMDYIAGNGPSNEKSVVMSGGGISSLVIVTATDNFEISTGSGPAFQGGQQMLFQPVANEITAKTIYVRLKSGLTASSYSGSISFATSGYTTKNVTLSGTITSPVVLLKDPDYYIQRNNGTLTFSNNWLFSRNLGNYINTSDLLGATSTVRGMAVRNGKMLFCSRSTSNQLISIDGKTGVRTAINLATNVFKYTGRNFNNTADSLYTVSFPCNDIKVDKGGNVLVSNLMTSSTSRFQIWKVNSETGSGSLLIDQKDFSLISPASTVRIDGFYVLGDVNTIANIYAVCSSTVTNIREMYRWSINSGIASSVPFVTNLDKSPEAAFGSATCISTIDGENFYIDGDKIMPFKYNINTGFSDSFKNYPIVYTDSITSPMYKSKISQPVNGVTEFTVGSDKFLIVGATSYIPTSLTPPAAFRIYKYDSYSDKIADLQCLWTFPLIGMGNTTNASRMVISAVEVNGKVATIYIYYPENGYGVYQLNVGLGTDTNPTKLNSDITVWIDGNDIKASEELSQLEVYTVTGQLLKSVKNTMSVTKPAVNGVYIVKTMNSSGETHSQKIIIQ